jgi:N-methylhydantoinase A
MARVVAGIDVGGTFTDLILFEAPSEGAADGRVRLAKIHTTPENQAIGVLGAIRQAGATPGELDLIIHGTTTTTNAVLERKISRCGLITTRGFRDTLELGRRTRPQPYGMTGTFEPLVPRERRLEVDERMDVRGQVVTPLDEDEMRVRVEALKAMGVESLIIHFLHAYANPVHELRACEIARDIWPNGYITMGHSLLSEFREYERGTTASVNAAVQPILDRYIQRLQSELETGGYDRDLLVMNGNGGTVAARIVSREAAKTVMSGPASGVIAAAVTSQQAGIANVIAYDMGGTSTDVALIAGGVPEVSSELQIAYGLPIHVPMVDVRTVGAGGGSIGYISAAGILQVGPESAGADPGPICYGRGGRLPTITDANLLLGRLNPEALFAVDKPVSLDEVRAIFEEALAGPLRLTVDEAASAMIQIANLQMAGAIRMVSLSRGHDPRDFALFAFGGAGPLHAVSLARELNIPRVLVPARPGLTNALGCLVADLRQDMVNTLNRPLDDVDMAEVGTVLEEQKARGLALNGEEQDEIVSTAIFHSADMQFRGQTHLIRVAIPRTDISRDELQALFEEAYFQRFQIRMPEIRANLVNLNTSVIGQRRRISLKSLIDETERAASLDGALVGERLVHFDGTWAPTPVYRRERLPAAAVIEGPAIVEQLDATIVIEPGTTARGDEIGNLIIDVPLAFLVEAGHA